MKIYLVTVIGGWLGHYTVKCRGKTDLNKYLARLEEASPYYFKLGSIQEIPQDLQQYEINAL